MKLRLVIDIISPPNNLAFRMSFRSQSDFPIGTVWSNEFKPEFEGQQIIEVDFPLSMIPVGIYAVSIGFHEIHNSGNFTPHDHITSAFRIEITQMAEEKNVIWSPAYWGAVRFPNCLLTVKV